MAYNLRRGFLLAHKDLVTQLIGLADRREWVRVECRDPEDANAKQYRINNLLYILARYHPDRGYVRSLVRTKLEWGVDGSMTLWLGVPPDGVNLRGSKPLTLEPVKASRSAELVIDEAVTEDSWTRISLSMLTAAAGDQIEEIVLRLPPEPEGIEFIAKQLGPFGFDLVSTKPVVRLKRVRASADIALPSA